MAVPLLASKKKALVQELNSFIAQKKAASDQHENRTELMGTSKASATSTGKTGGLMVLRMPPERCGTR